jgi:hypothetical protein
MILPLTNWPTRNSLVQTSFALTLCSTASCLPIATSSTFTFLSLFSITFTLLLTMNSDQLNPTEMALLQSLLNRVQSQPAAATPVTQAPVDAHFQSRANGNGNYGQLSTTTGSIPGPPAQQGGSNSLPASAGPPMASLSTPFPRIPVDPSARIAQQGSSTTTPIVRPYESPRTATLSSAPYGHPSGHPSTGSSSQPFLGFNNIGVSTRGQVNQQRLAAAASHQPRQPRLPSRGGRSLRGRGPAIQPPSMPRAPKFDDCILNVIDTTGDAVPGLRVKVKVYPPTKVCDYPFTTHVRHIYQI